MTQEMRTPTHHTVQSDSRESTLVGRKRWLVIFTTVPFSSQLVYNIADKIKAASVGVVTRVKRSRWQSAFGKCARIVSTQSEIVVSPRVSFVRRNFRKCVWYRAKVTGNIFSKQSVRGCMCSIARYQNSLVFCFWNDGMLRTSCWGISVVSRWIRLRM